MAKTKGIDERAKTQEIYILITGLRHSRYSAQNVCSVPHVANADRQYVKLQGNVSNLRHIGIKNNEYDPVGFDIGSNPRRGRTHRTGKHQQTARQ